MPNKVYVFLCSANNYHAPYYRVLHIFSNGVRAWQRKPLPPTPCCFKRCYAFVCVCVGEESSQVLEPFFQFQNSPLCSCVVVLWPLFYFIFFKNWVSLCVSEILLHGFKYKEKNMWSFHVCPFCQHACLLNMGLKGKCIEQKLVQKQPAYLTWNQSLNVATVTN